MCDACHMEREELQKATTTTNLAKRRVASLHSPPLDLFDQVQICSGPDLISNPSLERWTESGVDCIFVKQSRCVSFYESSPYGLVIPSAAEESQHRICCVVSLVSSALHPNFNNQFHCCRRFRECSDQLSFATG